MTAMHQSHPRNATFHSTTHLDNHSPSLQSYFQRLSQKMSDQNGSNSQSAAANNVIHTNTQCDNSSVSISSQCDHCDNNSNHSNNSNKSSNSQYKCCLKNDTHANAEKETHTSQPQTQTQSQTTNGAIERPMTQPQPQPQPQKKRPVAQQIPISSDGSALFQMVNQLPLYGTIHHCLQTNYWFIKLPDEWQGRTSNIVEICEKEYSGTQWCTEGFAIGAEWKSEICQMLTNDALDYAPAPQPINPKSKSIRWVSPPSMAGLHISLGTFPKGVPPCVKAGNKVRFELCDMRALKAIRPHPMNLPGQFTDTDGLRYYPTFWIFVRIKLVDLPNNITLYHPHISLACVAVRLSFEHVNCLTQKIKERQEEQNKPISSSSNSS